MFRGKKELKIIILLIIIIIVLGAFCTKLFVDNRRLQKEVEIQHNNYTECVSNSIEIRWQLEQYQYMFELGYAVDLDTLNNSDYCDNR